MRRYSLEVVVSPCRSCRFHSIGNGDVLGPDIELPFTDAYEARKDDTRVDTNPHVDGDTVLVSARKQKRYKNVLSHFAAAKKDSNLTSRIRSII